MEAELHDEQSALEAYEEASRSFEGNGLLDNVLNPVFAFLMDGLLGCKLLKNATRNAGLNGQTIIQECRFFEYEGRIAFLNPDANMEKLLSEVSESYGNNLSMMPQEKVVALQRIKDILKEMAESVIIQPQAERQTVDQMIQYSNDLSGRHYELKAEMQRMAV